MVTTMDDPCPNGVQEVEEEVVPSGQAGVEGPPAVRSSQGADTSGGEEMRRKRWLAYTQRCCSFYVCLFELEDLIENSD